MNLEFAKFYRDAVPKLVTFLNWQGASLADAADCAQEALIKAYEQWAKLRSPYTWCRVVASRIYIRRISTVRERPVDDVDGVTGSPLLARTDRLDEFEQRHRVLSLLDQLPPQQRRVMAWKYDGASATEIAEALEISPEAVRSNLYKARMALRRITREDQ